MLKRFIKEKIEEALTDTPVIYIAGPRQSGKTTLVKEFNSDDTHYATFDDLTTYTLIKNDPAGYIRNLSAPRVILDEVQRVPEIFLCIKQSVDENRKAGRFLLTGSSNAMTLPKILDSLAGRMETIPLFPLSESEIRGVRSSFLLSLLEGKAPKTKETRIRETIIKQIIKGGFPEPINRTSDKRRNVWYTQYCESIIQKDIKEITQIENVSVMSDLLVLLANRVGHISNYEDLSSKISSCTRPTIIRYVALLEQVFLLSTLPAWHRNDNKRLIKSPKIHLIDSGLTTSLRRYTFEKLNRDPTLIGPLLESYVYTELLKQSSWIDEPLNFYHYRDKDKVEVDLVIETLDRKVIGIEVKLAVTLNKKDFQGLERLKRASGEDFNIGILLHDGDSTLPFSENIFAVPIASLWTP